MTTTETNLGEAVEWEEATPGRSHRILDQWRPNGFIPAHPPVSVVMAVGVVLVLLVCYLDWATGPEVAISYFYTVPVLFTTWFAGRKFGYITVIVTAVSWLMAEKLGAAKYTRHLMPYVNVCSRALWLTLAVTLLSAFKTLRDHLGELVEDRTKAMRRLASQLSEAEDTERRRLAYDIHDGFSQMLLLIKLNLSGALADSSDDSAAKIRTAEALGLVSELIQRSRTLTFELHPAMLDHLGLVPTLRRYGEEFGRHAKIDITVNEEGMPRPLSSVSANYLFRSVKELINNAVRHGQAKQIVASLFWSATHLRIVIDDDGIGFDTTKVLTSDATSGLGLAGIQERLHSLGGTMRLESSDGNGSRIILEILLVGQEIAG